MIEKQTAIDFANWYRREDIPENAEKYFGFSDEDMLNYYLELIKINCFIFYCGKLIVYL